MHEVLVNRLGDLSLPRKSVVRLTGRPDMTDVYRGRKTTMQQAIVLADILSAGTTTYLSRRSASSAATPGMSETDLH